MISYKTFVQKWTSIFNDEKNNICPFKSEEPDNNYCEESNLDKCYGCMESLNAYRLRCIFGTEGDEEQEESEEQEQIVNDE